MKKWKSNLFPVITLAVCLGLAACGGGRKPLEITVVNRTTYPCLLYTSTTAAVGVQPAAIGKLLGACIFPGGLTMVLDRKSVV